MQKSKPFRVIIAGGRDFDWKDEHLFKIDELLCQKYDMGRMEHLNGCKLEMVTGCAKGADQIPYYYKTWHGVPIKEFPADWDKHGKKAGILRNIEMADYADALIAFHDGSSRGTQHMINTARTKGLMVRVVKY